MRVKWRLVRRPNSILFTVTWFGYSTCRELASICEPLSLYPLQNLDNLWLIFVFVSSQVYSWGHNDYGQLGHGTINVAPKKDSYKRVTTAAIITNRESPVIVQGLLKGKAVAKISCGTNFSVAVLDNGEVGLFAYIQIKMFSFQFFKNLIFLWLLLQVYSWGSNNHGQLGVSDQGATNFTSPNRVCELNGTVIKKITCGASYVMAVSDIGELFVWGRNDSGQLGLGDTSSRLLPTKVEELGKYVQILLGI